MKQKMQGIGSLSSWLKGHEIDMNRYLQQTFDYEDWGIQKRYMKEHPYFAKVILENFLDSNLKKQDRFLSSFGFGKSKIITVVGARGSGKTASACWVADKLHMKGYRNIYMVKEGSSSDFPEFINVVSDVEYVPNNSFAIIDETAIKYNNRNMISMYGSYVLNYLNP